MDNQHSILDRRHSLDRRHGLQGKQARGHDEQVSAGAEQLSHSIDVGYLGPPGSFCEEAAGRLRKALPRLLGADLRAGIDASIDADLGAGLGASTSGPDMVTLVPRRTIREAIDAVESGELSAAVVPAENSIEGSVSETLDSLIRSTSLLIQGEIVIPVSHNLMIWPGGAEGRAASGLPSDVKPSDVNAPQVPHIPGVPQVPDVPQIDEILSHPQALAQCRNYLAAHFPHVVQRATTSTAEAAREVASRKETGPFCAAIGTLRAAQLYGLSVIARDIQDVPENETRFILLAKNKRATRTGRDKTSIAFSTVRDRPGALYSILEEFAVRSINLTKIESRPTKRMLGEYIFFVDCEGHEDDPLVKEAIKALEPKTSYLKILGSYPAGT